MIEDMIQFLSTGHDYTIKTYLADSGQELAAQFEVLTYGQFFSRQRHPQHAAYIFSDLERVLHPHNLQILQETWPQLLALPQPPRILNRPDRVLKRLDLLQTLYAEGLNRFQVYPLPPMAPEEAVNLEQLPQPERFPVFIREANDHAGNLSPLLHSQTELLASILKLKAAGKLTGCPMVTEFISVCDDRGYYRKYSAFRIGDAIFAAHILIGKDWVQKDLDLDHMEKWMTLEDYEYVVDNPHLEELSAIFDLAGIDFGRIDYGLYQGKIQVFEINTNPMLQRLTKFPQHPFLQARADLLVEKLRRAFRALLD